MDALVRSMTALAPSSSGALGSAGGEDAASPHYLPPRLPVSTASAADARLALLEQQLLAAEQQREAANQQLLEALQRADAAAADAARCAALQQRLQELEVCGLLFTVWCCPALALPHAIGLRVLAVQEAERSATS